MFNLKHAPCFELIKPCVDAAWIFIHGLEHPSASTSSSSTRRWTTTSWRCGTARARAESCSRSGAARCCPKTPTVPSTSSPYSLIVTTSSASLASPYSSPVRDAHPPHLPYCELSYLLMSCCRSFLLSDKLFCFLSTKSFKETDVSIWMQCRMFWFSESTSEVNIFICVVNGGFWIRF